MKKIIAFFLVSLLTVGVIQAAFLRNIPRQVTQPNGEVLNCFISGDEFHHWLHDEKGFTIVQDVNTGYYVYANLHHDQLVPTSYIAGKVDPAQMGLQKNLNISAAKWQTKQKAMMKNVPDLSKNREGNTNTGHLNNLVVFIRFADDSNFTNSFASVNAMFNDSTQNYNSMYNYFKYTSYNQLFITSSFYPAPQGDLILSYQDTFPRAYFEKYSATNTIGYPDDADQRAIREQELMKRAIEYIELMVPEDLNIDYNQDDLVDNVCFVVRGDIGDWSDLLWPHRWSLYWTEAYLHGKRVYDYNFQLADAEPYFTNSVMSHEMFHSLGAPDLYHYADPAHLEPVGPWDLMAANTNPPQQTNAYMKYKYGKWIDEIPELTEYGTYTLYPLNSQQNLPKYYKIATQNPDEFFLLEYRRKRQPFDDQIFDSGLMIYRINTSFSGNASYNGFDILDEVYVFRYGGDLYTNGTISAAPFRQNSVRRSFTTNSNPHAFLSNGDPVEILIDHITIPSDSIQFDYNFYVGMENFQKDETISIYPNPTTDDITIKAKSLNMNNIQVYDIFGKLIIETKINQNQAVIHLTDYPSGIYLIKITDQNNNIKTLKAVKQSF